MILRTQNAVIVFIVDIFIPWQITFLRHRAFVWQGGYSSAVNDLLADPRRFVPRVCCHYFYFGIMLCSLLKHSIKRHAVMYVSRRYLYFQHISVLFAHRVRFICKALPVLALVKQAALRIGRGFDDCLFFRRLWAIVVVIIFIQRLLSVRCTVCIDLFQQLLLIYLRCFRYRLRHMLLQVRIRFDVRSVYKHHFRRQIPRLPDFFQYPAEYFLDHFSCEPMPECIAHRRKVRQCLRHAVSQKPTICYVDFHFLHRLPQRPDPEQVLYHHQLEQDHRVDAWPSLVLAV